MSDHLDGVLKVELAGCKQTAAARNTLMVIVGHYRTRDHPINCHHHDRHNHLYIYYINIYTSFALIIYLSLHFWFDATVFLFSSCILRI